MKTEPAAWATLAAEVPGSHVVLMRWGRSPARLLILAAKAGGAPIAEDRVRRAVTRDPATMVVAALAICVSIRG